MRSVVLCGTLIDGTGSDPVTDAAIHIDNGAVSHIGRDGDRIDSDVEVVDLRELTVLPGLVDSHDHFGLDMGHTEEQAAQPVEYIAIRAGRRAHDILRAGITTVRDAGEKGLVGPMIKRAVEAGMTPGPRIFTAARPISRTGGHGWYIGREADGESSIRQAIRDEIRAGADLIKIMATGGVASEGSALLSPEFTDEEINAAVDEAHRRGRKVAAHAHGGEGARSAIRAGVDSVEHGFLLTSEDIDLLVQHKTYLVVTAGVFEEVLANPDTPPHMKQKVAGAKEGFDKVMGRSIGNGLRLALGTDTNHGRIWREMELLVEVGYPAMETIVAGTSNGGDLIGDPTIGRLTPGSRADLIAINGDPLQDVRSLTDVRLVMKAGVVEFADDSLYGMPRWSA